MPGEATPLELWGGVECTIVRLGDDYRDQSEETGHRARTEDIGLICDLGVKASGPTGSISPGPTSAWRCCGSAASR
jgi:hypothetical protein